MTSSRLLPKTSFSKPSTFDSLYDEWDSRLPYSAGAYMVLATDTVPRAGGTDPNGVLYMGTTRNLRLRLWKFWDGRGHTAGAFLYAHHRVASTLLRVNCRSDDDVSDAIGRLHLIYAMVGEPELAERMERALLGQYTILFGEVPPLNFNLPGKHQRRPSGADIAWAKRTIGRLRVNR